METDQKTSTIRIAGKQDKRAWDDYILNHPKGNCYQLFAWKNAIEDAYGFKTYYLMSEQYSKIVGVFPLAAVGVPLMPKVLVSLPYCDAGGPLARSASVEASLIRHALVLARSYHAKELSVRSTGKFAGLDKQMTLNPTKVRMLMAIPGNSKDLLASFKAKLRRQNKKAFKNGLSAEIGSTALLDDFYTVFSENMRDLGSPVHSRKWIKAILSSFKNRAHLVMVRTPDNKPAAAGIVLCHPRAVSVPWASSLRRYNRLNPNMMLYWTFLKFASDNGYRTFDFGRSTPGEGTYRFKKQWGAKPLDLHWASFSPYQNGYKNLTPRPMSEIQGIGMVRATVENVLKRLPLSFSKPLGSLTRKYITL